MKYKKAIYLTAFLLSLSLILLLEVSSLGLLAEDIKVSEKEVVEIELLLSAADNSTGDKEQPEARKKVEQFKEEKNDDQSKNKTEKNLEVDKNSLEKNKKVTKKQKNENVEEEKNKNMIKKKSTEDKNQLQAEAESQESEPAQKIKKEPEEEEVKEDEPPAWLKKLESKTEADSSAKAAKDEKTENEKDEFDLEKYLAELEKEKVNSNSNQSKKPSNLNSSSEIKNNYSKKNYDKFENEGKNSVTAENNKADTGGEVKKEKKIYDLRTGNNEQIKKPGIKNYSQPEYPADLRKRNIEGEVIVSLRIDEKGNVHDLKINKSSGFSSFDQAALKAVSKWEFKPALKDQQKVQVIVNLPIRFELK